MGMVPLLNLPKLRSLVILPCSLSEEKMQPRDLYALQEPLGTAPEPRDRALRQTQLPFKCTLGSQRLARSCWHHVIHVLTRYQITAQHLTRKFSQPLYTSPTL